MRPDAPELTPKQERACVLIAEDDLTDELIAADLRISKMTLERWKKRPAVQARVREVSGRLSADLERFAIARKDRRMAAYEDRWKRQRQVIAERAADPTMARVPGGRTGMVVRTFRMMGQGPFAERVEEYSYDTGLDAAMRATEKQAAQEAGQWSERSEQIIDADISFTLAFDRQDDRVPQTVDVSEAGNGHILPGAVWPDGS